jgi:hypothetical protein
MTAPTPTQFRRGDTVRWPEVDYEMYVTVVDGDKVTTDAWADIPAAELTLVYPVEDRYETLYEEVSIAIKERGGQL